MLKNSSGEDSGSWTMVWIAFLVVMFWLFVSIIPSITIKTFTLTFRAFDGAEAMSVLTPLLTLYGARRWTEAKKSSSSKDEEDVPEPAEK